jgi:hypothetical protein
MVNVTVVFNGWRDTARANLFYFCHWHHTERSLEAARLLRLEPHRRVEMICAFWRRIRVSNPSAGGSSRIMLAAVSVDRWHFQ